MLAVETPAAVATSRMFASEVLDCYRLQQSTNMTQPPPTRARQTSVERSLLRFGDTQHRCHGHRENRHTTGSGSQSFHPLLHFRLMASTRPSRFCHRPRKTRPVAGIFVKTHHSESDTYEFVDIRLKLPGCGDVPRNGIQFNRVGATKPNVSRLACPDTVTRRQSFQTAAVHLR